MFYEIKEKPLEHVASTNTRWWLIAAFSAVIITASFVAIIFWLGVTSRQEVPSSSYLDRQSSSSSFREFEFRPLSPTRETVAPTVDTAVPLPKFEYPSAEILRTSVKNKKAKIEMVDFSDGGDASSLRPVTFNTVRTETVASEPQSTTIDNNRTPNYPESEITTATDSGFKRKTDDQKPADGKYSFEFQLQDAAAINPLEALKQAPEGDDEDARSVKKSEAVPPGWFDPKLQKPDPMVYDVTDFSSIKPDLSSFNMKTIPAFTYLKEPAAAAPAEYDSNQAAEQEILEQSGANYDNEYAYYYRHGNLPKPNPNPNRSGANAGGGTSDKEDNEPTSESTNFLSFIKGRLRDFQDWVVKGGRKRADLVELFKTVNSTMYGKGVGVLFGKLKEFYAKINATDLRNMPPVPNFLNPTSPSVFNNTNSLVSFGLLAIDLFLLHNVQQIVWNEESKIGEEMLKDPDVLALNSLFLPPERVQQLRETSNSRIFTNRENRGMLNELIEFVNGVLRAVLNLSKAYKTSTANRARSSKSGTTTIDCIWTLYCRNLDKTAKLRGPYGFLAKMNSLGLRLMMGEFPVDKAMDKLMKEYNSGWASLNCDKLFPRCSADEAKEVVIQTAMGQTSV